MNILRLISTKLDTAVIKVANKCFVTTSSCGCIANRAHKPVKSDSIEDTQQKICSHNGLQHKTLYIKELEDNQIKVDIITEITVDQRLTKTSAWRYVANKACNSKRLQ